jgi:hypothetical protein
MFWILDHPLAWLLYHLLQHRCHQVAGGARAALAELDQRESSCGFDEFGLFGGVVGGGVGDHLCLHHGEGAAA